MSENASGNAARPAGPRTSGSGTSGGGRVQGFNPLPTGTRIGELVVQSVLGAGAFGITYIAEHEKRSKRYVLKEYYPRAIAFRDGATMRPAPQHATAFTWGLERFITEARGLQQIKHPAVVALLGITQFGGTGYAGMSYEAGRDFGIWLHEQKRIAPQEEIDKILAPLLEGLALAHAAKVFHFDLNPDCIIIRDNGTPVLVDFGVYRVGLRRRMPPGNLAELTYAAPELLAAAGGPIGPWTDIYSLAGLLYLSVTGKPPLSAVERANGNTLAPAAASAQASYRKEFLAAIDAGLKLVPAQRPQSLADWAKPLLRTSGSRFGLPLLSMSKPAPPPAKTVSQKPAAVREDPEPISLGAPPPITKAEESSASPAAPSASPVSGGILDVAIIAATVIIGGLAGVAASYAAGMLRSNCAGADCAAPFFVPLAAIGAMIGLWEGVRFTRRRAAIRMSAGYEI